MRWRFRPSTEPPRLAQLLAALVTPPDERQVLLSDLQDEFEELMEAEGSDSARHTYWEQVRRSLAPGLAWRLGRLGRRRGALGWLARVPAWWRPEPEIPTDSYNRGENMSDYLKDVKLALRGLAKSPVLFAVVVLSLAIGIGASTTVFSMANAFLLRPAATDLPDDYVAIFTSDGDGSLYGDTSYPDYLDMLDGVEAIDGTLLHRAGGVELDDGAGRKRLLVEIVGGRYFELMHLPLTLGRGFTAEENAMGRAERLVVLDYHLWQQRYGADPEILGRAVRLDGHPYTVIGVGPKGYLSRLFGLRIDAWVPMGVPGGIYHVRPSGLADRSDRQYRVLARLKPGASFVQVRAQLGLLAARLQEEYPEAWKDSRGGRRTLTVLPEEEALLPDDLRAGLGGFFAILLLGTGLIVLIACSNVACIFLARVNLRRREMAMRLALGAQRRRLVLMLLVESLVPALLAGVLGSFLASWACAAMGSIKLPSGIPIPLQFDFQLDHRVLVFAFVLSVLTSLFFGLVPALQGASPDLVSSLKADRGTGERATGKMRLRRLLVVVQLAAALAFAVGTGLMLRSVQAASSLPVGLDIEKNAVMARDLPESRFSDEEAASYLTEIVERLRRRPDVDDAQLATSAELSVMASVYEAVVDVDGYERAEGERMAISHNAVTPGYLEMMGIRLLRGRTIEDRDRPGAPLAAVVSQSFAERFWPNGEALGKSFRAVAGDRPQESLAGDAYQVVGVVADGRYTTLDRESPFFWTALAQGWDQRVMIHVRGRTSAADALRALGEEAHLEPGESMWILPTTYENLISIHLTGPRLVARLFGWGGIFALALAVMGVYGIVSFTVTQRTREMAIRQALGARPAQVVREVVADGLRLSLWGLAVGLAVALPLAVLARSDLYGLSPLDPVAVGGSAAVLLAAALLASFIPARRVSELDAMEALREE